jgi:hypothetical protein
MRLDAPLMPVRANDECARQTPSTNRDNPHAGINRRSCGCRPYEDVLAAWRSTIRREAASATAQRRAEILGTAIPELKLSLDSLEVMEEAMRHFYIKAMVEKSVGAVADWKAVDAAIGPACVDRQGRGGLPSCETIRGQTGWHSASRASAMSGHATLLSTCRSHATCVCHSPRTCASCPKGISSVRPSRLSSNRTAPPGRPEHRRWIAVYSDSKW